MSALPRVVFDTSSLVGAALQAASIPHRALAHVLAAGEVCVSFATMAELEKVLARPKFDRYQSRQVRADFVELLQRNARMFAVAGADEVNVNPRCRDPKDDKFLALARACEADIIISSDADLLVMHPWHGVPIQTPAAFVASIDA